MRISIRNNKNFHLSFILFFISFCYFLYGYRYFDIGTFHYDEGISAYGAVRILDGNIPYRGFWTLYAPGQFYILAAIFKMFGISLKVVVLFAITVVTLTVCSVYLLIKKLCSEVSALFAFLLSLAWLKSYMVYIRPGQLAILFLIFCCFALLRYIESGRNGWLFITGILVGITGLFRQDFGFYILISISLLILLKQLNYYKDEKWEVKLGLILKSEFYLFSGLFLVLLPVFIYFIAKSVFKELVSDTLLFPTIIYPRVRNLPFPEIKKDSLIFYLPLFVFLLTCVRLLTYNWKDRIVNPIPWLLLFFLFSGLGLFNYTRVRTSFPQLLPTMVPAIILFILLFDGFLKRIESKNLYLWKISILIASFLISFVLLFYSIKPNFIKLKSLSKEGILAKLDVSRARGFYDGSELAHFQSLTIKYIQDKTEKNEMIFVGNLRHDRIVNSDVMFYFLCERHSATKYYELHPGLTNTQIIQNRIIDELRKVNVRYIVLWSGSEGVKEPNESSKSSGIMVLDNFIHTNYQIEKSFGPYLILKHI